MRLAALRIDKLNEDLTGMKLESMRTFGGLSIAINSVGHYSMIRIEVDTTTFNK